MRIKEDYLEMNSGRKIYWEEVSTLRLINDVLALVLKTGEVIEIPQLHPYSVDQAFRLFEGYVKEHPQKKTNRRKSL